MPNKIAIQLKIKLKLTKTKYELLRKCLDEYIRLPCYKTIATEMKFLVPTLEDPLDYELNNEVIGKYWHPLKLAQNAIEDLLEVYHGHDEKRVPGELWCKAKI